MMNLFPRRLKAIRRARGLTQSELADKLGVTSEEGPTMESHHQQSIFGEDGTPAPDSTVECLGMTFASHEERRAYFLERLKDRLPELRKRPDFPLGEDEDILRLSDPPYYTACPNPFLADFVRCYGRPYDPEEPYHRAPSAVDVSEGKTDPLYRAHSYHTKVPYLAIVPSILHYTKPGDIVLDGFCGSGMTGVAAQWCGTASADYRRELETRWAQEGRGQPEWGARRVILGDLSPAATFIAANYNLPFDVEAFGKAAQSILDEVEAELGWMYATLHTDGTKGRINYTVWSEVFSCPECSEEIVFVKEALDLATKRIRETFPCPRCGTALKKRMLTRLYTSRYDTAVERTVRAPKRIPVIVNYNASRKKYEKVPDEHDMDIIARIYELPYPFLVPKSALPHMHMTHQRARMDLAGITHLHHFFPSRAAHALDALWRSLVRFRGDLRLKNALTFLIEQGIWTMSLMNLYQPQGFKQVNKYLPGVYYIPANHCEVSPWYALAARSVRFPRTFRTLDSRYNQSITTTGDCSRSTIPEQSVDYIFTDPPFGENIYYADLNYIVESWHRVLTSTDTEAIIDRHKGKGMPEYQSMMQRCFEEYHRVLKPGRWITIVFHNSKNAVWNAIQEALLAAGFVVADVRTMDKQQGSYRQVTSQAVKQDLVISAYKPNQGLEERFKLQAGTEEGAWAFVRVHLGQLPVFVAKEDRAEVIAERCDYLLFDRMVAFHVLRGVTVPLSAAEFYTGLEQRFPVRDGMYFLSEQVTEYERKRMTVKEVLQLQLFVKDEESALLWLKQELTKKPQTFQEIHPQFMRELSGWAKHEKQLELSEMLEESFLRYDGVGDVPAPIHSYLSSNYKDLRGLAKDDAALRAKAKERWYVPDPRRAGDLEKLRERSLLREFAQYREGAAKKLKVFRLEAVRAGFRKAWQERDYATIIAVAQRIPDAILQEDAKLLMWFDQATTRSDAAT